MKSVEKIESSTQGSYFTAKQVKEQLLFQYLTRCLMVGFFRPGYFGDLVIGFEKDQRV